MTLLDRIRLDGLLDGAAAPIQRTLVPWAHLSIVHACPPHRLAVIPPLLYHELVREGPARLHRLLYDTLHPFPGETLPGSFP